MITKMIQKNLLALIFIIKNKNNNNQREIIETERRGTFLLFLLPIGSHILAEFQNCSPKNAREHFVKCCQKSHECSRAFSYLKKKVTNAREHFPIWKKKS
jgi:hypothetical protein